MIKLTVRYSDEDELRQFLRLLQGRITVIHPRLSRPAKVQPKTGHFRRDIYLERVFDKLA